MKIKDLRVGNLLMNFLGEVFEVNAQTIYNFDLPSEFPKPKPIPLTEEWLEKFGFKKEKKFLFSYKNFYINFHQEGIATTFLDTHLINGIGYVHQLQNLYFALTEEELEIKIEN